VADSDRPADVHPDDYANRDPPADERPDLLAGRSPGCGRSSAPGVPARLVDGSPDGDPDREPDADPNE
jgi:hypothetical protein